MFADRKNRCYICSANHLLQASVACIKESYLPLIWVRIGNDPQRSRCRSNPKLKAFLLTHLQYVKKNL